MTVNELLGQLRTLQELGHGNADICVMSEHGERKRPGVISDPDHPHAWVIIGGAPHRPHHATL